MSEAFLVVGVEGFELGNAIEGASVLIVEGLEFLVCERLVL
jgi:hypothetical protein